MNYRHKPHKDTRQTPTAAQLQQKVVDVRGLIHEMRTIVAEGEQPLVKITIMCNFCVLLKCKCRNLQLCS